MSQLLSIQKLLRLLRVARIIKLIKGFKVILHACTLPPCNLGLRPLKQQQLRLAVALDTAPVHAGMSAIAVSLYICSSCMNVVHAAAKTCKGIQAEGRSTGKAAYT